ncbi:MAG: hypothetical protein HRT88_00565 [Lentisphaeraceae bacterium]|nr:hypothetical protein [Lentisphaeraceae bacterium]
MSILPIIMYALMMVAPLAIMLIIEHRASVIRERKHHDEVLKQLHYHPKK